ncbi:McrB family protein [Thermosyntropha lipolytica]|nr:AAA family ATPase [Thermosyntropha lipolytica]
MAERVELFLNADDETIKNLTDTENLKIYFKDQPDPAAEGKKAAHAVKSFLQYLDKTYGLSEHKEKIKEEAFTYYGSKRERVGVIKLKNGDKLEIGLKYGIPAFIKEINKLLRIMGLNPADFKVVAEKKAKSQDNEEDVNPEDTTEQGDENDMSSEEKFSKIKNEIKQILEENKQIVLTGAPGVGKTYMAIEICQEIIKKENGVDEKNIGEYWFFIQFHPSYDYTDFVEGLRPEEKGDSIGFERKDGLFMEICRKAAKEEKSGKKYFLIIDEINRADLSKVFGELMYCLEYRGKKYRIKTQYSNLMKMEKKEHVFKYGFYIPENVYIIGTMNDIDRSVETFDFALRRRFFWYEIKANDVMEHLIGEMMNELLDKLLEDKKYKSNGNSTETSSGGNEQTASQNDEEELKNKLKNKLYKLLNINKLTKELSESAKNLNQAIDERGSKFGLDARYHVGPAYFKLTKLPEKVDNESIQQIKEKIWRYRIEPLLREYVRGYDAGEVEDFIKNLREAYEKSNSGKNSEPGSKAAEGQGE